MYGLQNSTIITEFTEDGGYYGNASASSRDDTYPYWDNRGYIGSVCQLYVR